MFTKQHYEWMAAAIRDISDLSDRRAVALAFSVHLKMDNPHFDSKLFLMACLVHVPNPKKET